MKIERTHNNTSKLYHYKFKTDKDMYGKRDFLEIFSYYDNLYFLCNEKNSRFVINKAEDTILYNLFDKLYIDIKEYKTYDLVDLIKKIRHNPSLEVNPVHIERANSNIKSNQKELFVNDEIKWVSDNWGFRDGKENTLTISKEEDNYILNFEIKDVYGRKAVKFNFLKSRYEPFNTCFMKLFEDLQHCDQSELKIVDFTLKYIPKHERKK